MDRVSHISLLSPEVSKTEDSVKCGLTAPFIKSETKLRIIKMWLDYNTFINDQKMYNKQMTGLIKILEQVGDI